MKKVKALSVRFLLPLICAGLLLLPCKKAKAQQDIAGEKLSRIYVSVTRSGNNYIVNQGNAYALFDKNGAPLTPFKYKTMISGFNGDMVVSSNESASKLLDSSGLVKAIFNQPLVYLRQAEKQYVNSSISYSEQVQKVVYNEDGALFFSYNEIKDGGNGLVASGDYAGKYYLTDTNGKRILERPFDYLNIGPKLAIATDKDSNFIISRTGKVLFQSIGKSIVPADDNFFALNKGPFWILIDSNGKKHTGQRFHSVEKAGIPGFAKADNNIIAIETGKPVLKDDDAYSIYQHGNWYDLNVQGRIENIIVDEKLQPVFKGQNNTNKEFIGPRFVTISSKYDDPDPVIYDRVGQKIVKLRIAGYIKDDFYFTEERNTELKRLVKGVKELPVTAFRNITKADNYPFYHIDDAVRHEHENSFQSYLSQASVSSAHGILDTQMKEIIPMRYGGINILSSNVILTIDSVNRKRLFDGKGKRIMDIDANREVYRNGAVIHIYGDDGSILLDTMGNILYKGKANIELLFAAGKDKTTTSFPALLMYEDSSGYAGVYNLKSQQLLPHHYYKVKDVMAGTFALKKGDSVYYANSHGALLYGGGGFTNEDIIMLPAYALILRNENGKYGTLSPEGITVLPFEYDTVFTSAGGYVIGKQGAYTLLNDAGQLSYPMQSWIPLELDYYGFIRASDNNYYAVNKGKVQAAYLSINDNLWQEINRNQGTFIIRQPNEYLNIPAGIYNRFRKRIANFTNGFNYLNNGIVMIVPAADSTFLDLIDTSGKVLIGGLKRKGILQLYNGALVIADTAGKDELYLEENGIYKKYLVDISSEDEEQLKNHFRQYSSFNGMFYQFKDSVGNGFVTANGSVYRDRKAEKIVYDGSVYIIRYSGKYGLMNYAGKWIQTPDADTIIRLRENFYTIIKAGKQGYYDPAATVSYVPPLYDRLYNARPNYNPDTRLVKNKDKFTLVGNGGQQLLPWMDSISITMTSVEHTAAYLNGKEVSLNYDDEGRVIIDSNEQKQVQYESVNGYREWLAIVARNKQYGLYDNRNYRFILPMQYDGITRTEKEHLYFAWRYKADKLAGIDSTIVVNQKGEIILRQKGFLAATDYISGAKGAAVPEINGHKLPGGYTVLQQIENTSLWLVEKNDKKGLANEEGQILLAASYEQIDANELEDGYLVGTKEVVSKEDVASLSALISPEGKVLTKAIYEGIEDNELNRTCTKPYFIVLKNELYGIIDNKGKKILGTHYDEISGIYNNEKAVVQKGASWGVINLETGKEILGFSYDHLSIGTDGSIYFQKGNESGYFDKEGNKVAQ